MEYSSGFSVTVRQSEVVKAVLPVQDHWLPMSNLDLLLPPLDFGIFFCYKKIAGKDGENINYLPVDELKKALAQVLATFYPLAGEIVQNRQGEPEILCNNRGVDFVQAYADVELKDIDLYRPEKSVHGKLVTELKCGGLFIGCTFDHRAADATSANMFLTAWAETARSHPITLLPSFRRSLFNPRRPPQPHKSLDKLYAPLVSMPPPSSFGDLDRLTSQIYLVPSDEIDRLQSQACCSGARRSKIESFGAFLWKTLAGAAVGDPSKAVKLGVVVDGRTRLGAGADRYFGNVLSIPYVGESAGALWAAPLSKAAEAVHGCVAEASAAEHFLALIDWVEMRRPKPAVVKVYCRDENDEAAVVVSSGLRFPVQELNFGWGGPEFGSYHFPWGGETGYVMPMRSARGNGDWVVYMHLKRRHLDLVEARAPHAEARLAEEHEWRSDDLTVSSMLVVLSFGLLPL
ncbi:HXXXD-type acyl-transferase family protein [Striga asiatica]|uniref:HXXXD-type acyl-transferase family protein n=1 Tax=Striga asiatica TaxID=4170 RepID=A0A5A7Q9W8_STRAF|nr:HXXXD-type acyl-transferase family protein [Striga asiatica]